MLIHGPSCSLVFSRFRMASQCSCMFAGKKYLILALLASACLCIYMVPLIFLFYFIYKQFLVHINFCIFLCD
ncbi:hypothetical protein VNO77_39724 [Canavalia gladiata]|uniref:Uncharacterized protein n=1 Tax=Canavalia gladiata TaxID=3824 RepID=A0AAN9JZY1_CANGL